MVRGTKRPVLKRTMDLRANIHNRFDIEVMDAATGEVKQRARAFNVICDVWWTRTIRLNSGWRPQGRMSYILFGSGSGTPAASDTTLFTQVGYKSFPSTGDGSLAMTYDVPAGVVYRQGYVTLQASEYVGSTLTEVALGYDSSHITTHAMLEDMNGNPISIEKTDTDVIKIYGTVYLHFPSGGWYNGSVMPAASQTSFYSALLGADWSSETLYVVLHGGAKRTGVITSKVVSATPTIDSANKKMTWTWRWNAADMNLPLRHVRVSAGYYSSSQWTVRDTFCLVPGSWYTPGAISAEAVGTGDGSATGFSTAFPVGTVGTVKVDGVAASGATMRPGPADVTELATWMNAVYLTNSGKPGFESNSYEANGKFLYTGTTSDAVAVNAKTLMMENPFYASVPIEKFRLAYNSGKTNITIFASDDMEHWTSAGEFTLPNSSGTANAVDCAVPSALRSKRYWQFQNTGDVSTRLYFAAVGDVADPEHNIVFSSPPAAGAVITADYTPDCVAKDENHVFDLTLSITLGEYQEA